eukprot:4808370-Pleurochrysis_carterae.AAC.1
MSSHERDWPLAGIQRDCAVDIFVLVRVVNKVLKAERWKEGAIENQKLRRSRRARAGRKRNSRDGMASM